MRKRHCREEPGELPGKGTASAKAQRHGRIWGVQGTEKRVVRLERGEHLLASFFWVVLVLASGTHVPLLSLLLEQPSLLLGLQAPAQVVPPLRSPP